MKQVKAKIILNKKIKGPYFHCKLLAPAIAKKASPGQFINIKVNDGFQPLLRRPISIHRALGKHIEILYEVVGPATQILSQRKPGELLDIIGPLGNGFTLGDTRYEIRDTILIAGGMGVAPLVFLAQEIKNNYPLNAIRSTLILIGARTKSEILCEKEFKDLGLSVKIATDDGSQGFKGRVTDLLKKVLRDTRYEIRDTIYACGPKPMLKEISRLSKEYKIPAQVSLEEHMSCGIGACLGCVVNTEAGYKRVCKDGPVFNSEEII